MIFNGEIPNSIGTIFTVPVATQGDRNSGSDVGFNLFRIVNGTAGTITFTIYLNVNGLDVPITPISRELIAGAAYDDIPEITLPAGGRIRGIADTAGVFWTVNTL